VRQSWQPGDQLLIRHVTLGRVVFAMPATVAAADDSELVLWVAPETPCIYPIGSDADRQVRPPGSWELRERQWYGAGVLHRFREGDAHSLMHIWDDNGRFTAWYVNLQQPFRPSRLGVDRGTTRSTSGSTRTAAGAGRTRTT